MFLAYAHSPPHRHPGRSSDPGSIMGSFELRVREIYALRGQWIPASIGTGMTGCGGILKVLALKCECREPRRSVPKVCGKFSSKLILGLFLTAKVHLIVFYAKLKVGCKTLTSNIDYCCMSFVDLSQNCSSFISS